MHPYKNILVVCFLAFSNFLSAQQYQINGRVSIHNSRFENGTIEFVEDAAIKSILTGDKLTDYKGRFELNFINIDPRSLVNLRFEKEGYEVVNKSVLENIMLKNNPTLRIFIAEKGSLEKVETELYFFCKKGLNAKKDSIFHLLNLKGDILANTIMDLEKTFGEKISDEMEAKLVLNQKLKDLETELPNYVHQLASVNLDFTSHRYQNAIASFRENQIENAIDSLDENQLDDEFENIVANIEKAKENPETLPKVLKVRKIQIDNVMNSYQLKTILLKLAFRFSEAEDLSERLSIMKAKIDLENKTESLTKVNQPEDIVEVSQIKNEPVVSPIIMLNDSLIETVADTNWVEIEMEKVLKEQAEENDVNDGNPKAMTILETIPRVSKALILGSDFENALMTKGEKLESEIPIYEKPEVVLVSNETKILINQSPSVEIEYSTHYSESTDVSESEIVEEVIAPPANEYVFSEIEETVPSTETFKITKKTSLRMKATSSSKVLKRLKVGTKVEVIEQVDRYWSKVILNGKVGYVKVLLLKKN